MIPSRVLILGAGGFLGHYLVREAVATGALVLGVDQVARPQDLLCDWAQLALPNPLFSTVLKDFQPSILIHAAGTASVSESLINPAQDFHRNVEVFAQILEAVRVSAPNCRILLLSSAAVYGNPMQLPITEDSPTHPLSPYGYHKLLCELLGNEYTQLYNLSFASARIFSAYGEGLRKQVCWDICQKILTTRQVNLAGTGHETRDFIHARDVARSVWHIVQHAPCKGECYNVAHGQAISIQQLAKLFVSVLAPNTPITFSGIVRQGDPLNWQADITALRQLGFTPEITLTQGVAAFAAWAAVQIQA